MSARLRIEEKRVQHPLIDSWTEIQALPLVALLLYLFRGSCSRLPCQLLMRTDVEVLAPSWTDNMRTRTLLKNPRENPCQRLCNSLVASLQIYVR